MDCYWDYTGKSIIVTGAASGIGAELCQLLARSGAGVVLVDRDKARLATATSACAKLAITEPLAILADVSDEQDIQRMVEATMARFGKIDCLVAGAAILYRTKFLDISLDEWDEVMATNVRGLMLCNQLVIAQMLKQGGGRIVNIASVAGRSMSLIGGAGYATAKHAVVGMTRHIAREFCQQGIRANAFCPGATNTPMIHDHLTAEQVGALQQNILLGRLAEADEQARVIAYMLSDAATYLNGACIDSNGGSVML
ncbi:MAG: SDR family oxidoreductase [Gammaproteobacteria bacterium]|jgi:NAD(P)-dependent dehydrogenase (short-subunit alcohol dehydrogenase family)|nr:SDR family oxidoreductase [Gammaproteobacteria bacterium]